MKGIKSSWNIGYLFVFVTMIKMGKCILIFLLCSQQSKTNTNIVSTSIQLPHSFNPSRKRLFECTSYNCWTYDNEL